MPEILKNTEFVKVQRHLGIASLVSLSKPTNQKDKGSGQVRMTGRGTSFIIPPEVLQVLGTNSVSNTACFGARIPLGQRN